MRLRFWVTVLLIAAGCATAQPPPPPEDNDEAKAKLDAAHRQGQADYNRAKKADEKPKK